MKAITSLRARIKKLYQLMTDYSEWMTQKGLSLVGGAAAIVYGLNTMAHLQVLTPVVEAFSTFLSTTFISRPFFITVSMIFSAFLLFSAKGASSFLGDVKNEGFDIEFVTLLVMTVLLATPSVASWAAGGTIGIIVSIFNTLLFIQVSRDSGLLSGAMNAVGEVK